MHPDWLAGISIGAINAAIIAGNAPEARVEKLREFWEKITAPCHGRRTPTVGLYAARPRALYAQSVSAAMWPAPGAGFFSRASRHRSFTARHTSRRRATTTRGR